MFVRLHNVGPVRRAEISLETVTVLLGPNGSGKTTVSTVLYAALLAHRDARRRAGIGAIRRAIRLEDESAANVLVDRLIQGWEEEFRDALQRHLERCVGDLKGLPREGRSGPGAAARIVIGTSRRTPRWQLVFQIQKNGSLILERSHKLYVRPRPPSRRESPSVASYEARLRRLLIAGLPNSATYFPAARSGFMQMRRALSALLIGALNTGYFSHATVGAIPGVAADFLQLLGTIEPSQEGQVPEKLVRELEHTTLSGSVLVAPGDTVQDVRFRPHGFKQTWPIEFAATSVAELAPLMLYLRHRARPSDAILIDEPEAHLHPFGQVRLVESLFPILQGLAATVIATHSEYVVSGLSNVLMAEVEDDPDTEPTDVAIYEFVPDPVPRRGVLVKPLKFDPASGFEVQQFSNVSDGLYGRAIDLYNSIHGIEESDGE